MIYARLQNMKRHGFRSIGSLLDASFPRPRESRFDLRPISLDTRFRGYGRNPDTPLRFGDHSLHVFSQEEKRITKSKSADPSLLRAPRPLRSSDRQFPLGVLQRQRIDNFIERYVAGQLELSLGLLQH